MKSVQRGLCIIIYIEGVADVCNWISRAETDCEIELQVGILLQCEPSLNCVRLNTENRIKSGWNFKKQCAREGLASTDSEYRPTAKSCEQENKSSGSIEVWKLLWQQTKCQVLKGDSTLWSYIHIVSGGKINILGGHGIGHFKQKIVHVHVTYSERFPR
jgi:hypothetical protein